MKVSVVYKEILEACKCKMSLLKKSYTIFNNVLTGKRLPPFKKRFIHK